MFETSLPVRPRKLTRSEESKEMPETNCTATCLCGVPRKLNLAPPAAHDDCHVGNLQFLGFNERTAQATEMLKPKRTSVVNPFTPVHTDTLCSALQQATLHQ